METVFDKPLDKKVASLNDHIANIQSIKLDGQVINLGGGSSFTFNLETDNIALLVFSPANTANIIVLVKGGRYATALVGTLEGMSISQNSGVVSVTNTYSWSYRVILIGKAIN